MLKESQAKERRREIEIESQPDGSILLKTTWEERRETEELYRHLDQAKELKNFELGFWRFSTLGLAAVGVGSFLGGLVQLSKGIAEGDEVQSLGSVIAVVGGVAVVYLANKVVDKADLTQEQATKIKEFYGKVLGGGELISSPTLEEKRD